MVLIRMRQTGFTLIELLIVIAIIGILAAIAIPMYRTQTVKARLTEVTHGISNIATAVSSYYQDNGTFPSAMDKTEIQSTLGVSLTQLTKMQSASVTNGAISVTIAGIGSEVDGSILTLTPASDADGSIAWSWGGDLRDAYKPK